MVQKNILGCFNVSARENDASLVINYSQVLDDGGSGCSKSEHLYKITIKLLYILYQQQKIGAGHAKLCPTEGGVRRIRKGGRPSDREGDPR